jgi:hypothetical protein
MGVERRGIRKKMEKTLGIERISNPVAVKATKNHITGRTLYRATFGSNETDTKSVVRETKASSPEKAKKKFDHPLMGTYHRIAVWIERH